MDDGRRDDAPPVPQARDDFPGSKPVDLHVRDRARLRRIEARMDAEPGVGRQPLSPPVTEIAKTRGLALRADPIVKAERFGYRVVVGCRMGPDLLELPDVVRLRRGRGLQRPQAGDVFPPHVKKPRADRREQPLVQARAVVVAAQIADLERELRERMRAVDNCLDPAPPRLVADLLHRKDLPREVGDVAEVQDLRRGSDGADQPAREIVHRRRRHRK